MSSGSHGDLLSGMLAIVAMVAALAVIYGFATGVSPWPVFVLAELPGAGFGFVLLALTSPRRR